MKADADKKKFKRPSEQCIKNLEQTSFNFAKIQGSDVQPTDALGTVVELQSMQ